MSGLRQGRMGSSRRGRTPTASGRWWVPLIKLVLTVAVTWLILRGAGIRLAEAWAVDWTLVRPNVPLLTLSILLLSATFGIAAFLWSRVLEEFGETRIGVAEGTAILLIANLGRYVPGKIVQLAGLAVLARRRGLSSVRATAAAITSQIVNLLGAAAVGGGVALWSADLSGGRSLVVGLSIVAAMIAFLSLGGVGVLLRWALRRSGHVGNLPQPEGRRLLLLLPWYVVNWMVHGAAFVCLCLGLGFAPGYWIATTAFAAAYFAGYVVLFAPAGIGIRESALVVLLTPVVGAQAGVVIAALQRVWMTAVELLGAAASAFVLRGSASRRDGESSSASAATDARRDAGAPASARPPRSGAEPAAGGTP